MARHDVRRENGRQRNARAQVVARAHDVTEMLFGGVPLPGWGKDTGERIDKN